MNLSSLIPSSVLALALIALPVGGGGATRGELTVVDCSGLTWVELDAAVPSLLYPPLIHDNYRKTPPPDPLRRGNLLLPCLEDLYWHGAKAKGLPRDYRQRIRSRSGPPAEYALRLLGKIHYIAPERAREGARKELDRGVVDERVITYAHWLVPDEKDRVLPLLAQAFKQRELRGRKAEMASLIGAYHDPSYLPLLEEKEDWMRSEAPRVAVAVMELRGNVAGLLEKVQRGEEAGGDFALPALLRLGRADLVRSVAASPTNPLRGRAQQYLDQESKRAKTPKE